MLSFHVVSFEDEANLSPRPFFVRESSTWILYRDGNVSVQCHMLKGDEFMSEVNLPMTVSDEIRFIPRCRNLRQGYALHQHIFLFACSAFDACDGVACISVSSSTKKLRESIPFENQLVYCIQLREDYMVGRTVAFA